MEKYIEKEEKKVCNVTIDTKTLKNLENKFWYVYNICEKIYTNDKRRKCKTNMN